MERKQNRITLDQIKEIDLVDFLSKLGFEPQRPPKGNDYWYCSPLAEERTASFHVNRKKNSWYDHGRGVGGNIIDFAIRYFNCTVGEFYHRMQDGFSFHQPTRTGGKTTEQERESIVEILSERPLFSYPLFNYLRERRIDLEVADRFTREVHFKIKEKSYFGIGFQNSSGGWALRNSFMKAASTPNDVTFMNNGSKQSVHLFEGFFDFLSFATIFKKDSVMNDNFCILNGTGMVKHALRFLEGHESKYLYLDNDKGGNNVTSTLCELNKSYVDHRQLYAAYVDLNEWHCNIGRPPPRRRQRIT